MRQRRTSLTPGEVVKELRLKKGWTQAILSEITEIAVSNLSNIENNRSRLGEDRALLLAEAFGVKPEFILFPNGFNRVELQSKLKSVREKLKKYELPSDVSNCL